MKYKKYLGQVVYDSDAKIFHGQVLRTNAVITFQGTNPEEIEQAFRDSVDDYIAWCKEQGKEPEKPFSGKFLLRMKGDLHKKLVARAITKGISLNSLILEKLEKSF